jgi:hypothetical protein
MNAGGGWGVLDCLKLVSTWFNAFLGETEAQVRNFFASKDALLEVDLNVMLDQSLQHLI